MNKYSRSITGGNQRIGDCNQEFWWTFMAMTRHDYWACGWSGRVKGHWRSGSQETRKFEGSTRGSTSHPSQTIESHFRTFLSFTSCVQIYQDFASSLFLASDPFSLSPGVTSDLVSYHYASLLYASISQAPGWWPSWPSWAWLTRQSPSLASIQGPAGAGPSFPCSPLGKAELFGSAHTSAHPLPS